MLGRSSELNRLDLTRVVTRNGEDSSACRPTSPTRSPPAKWSSGRRRSSRSWSRTRSTPARAASSITVEFGGKKLIRVEDDGEGMEPEDARLAIERHATSKIRRADDLGAHRDARLPRRGAAEHRVGLALRAADARARRRVRHRDSRQRRRRRVGDGSRACRKARRSKSRDLFYNLPARRKFLKSDGAESAQVSRIVTQLALCYPEVGFTLTSAGRKVLQVPPVASLRDRLYQLYGDRTDLVDVRAQTRRREPASVTSRRWPSRGRRAGRRTSSSTGAS